MRYCGGDSARRFSDEAMALPTAADLIEALRRDGESYEALASRLPISMSTVNRWKGKDPRDWPAIVTMLSMAGWLNVDGAATSRRQRGAIDPRLVQAAEQIADLAETLDALVSEQAPPKAAAQTRRRKRPA